MSDSTGLVVYAATYTVIYDLTLTATDAATRAATDAATCGFMFYITRAATYEAMNDAIRSLT